ncbi:winged helix-turn-helix domain-containing protein [Pseudomonas sp. NA-150]|uniref:winged helix-turn-helix domain-containing protein n=1 Tax=Pseudomonas sp. NA-150 TaxID=3367525 RepID=UPI0037C55D52
MMVSKVKPDELKETRRKLIDLIAEHQATLPNKKLSIIELSKRAKLSPQTLHRYYKDLKKYAYGEKPIGDLITDNTSPRTKELINQSQANLKQLQNKMGDLEADHDKEMKKTLDSYITSLMMNDVTLHGANDIRATLEKQTLHNLELKKQLNKLEIDLARAQSAAYVTANNGTVSEGKGEKIKVDVDLTKAFELYASTGSRDDFEDKKDAAIAAAQKSINKLAVDKQYSIVLFAERYLARFAIFFDRFKCTDDSLHIVVRVPIFDRDSLRIFLSKLPPTQSLTIYVPHLESTSEVNAQRGFYFGSVPKLEIDAADKADPILLKQGFHSVIHYKIKQGE